MHEGDFKNDPEELTEREYGRDFAASGNLAATGSTKLGVLLVNLGTPDAPEPHAVKRYLAEFLSDRRVIELHPLLWKPLLHGLILPVRSKRVAESYRKVWRHESDESPLRYFTRRQAELLAEELKRSERHVIVDWAMCYGSPSISGTLDDLGARGCSRILVAPLYPQYSATTSAAVIDRVFQSLKKMRRQPAVRTLPPYFNEPVYIETLARAIEAYLACSSNEPEVLIASFHGLPRAYVEAGDPYYRHCQETMDLLRERLGMDERFLRISFQSRFGPKEWLRPYTDETLIELAQSGIRKVAVFTPGFSADCLETLEEIAMQNRDLFLSRGGTEYAYIPCLNDSPEGIAMLAALIERELSGWI
ncbi:MAG: ferrochelatase [Gammaproteobacteria bacterium]